ncbi:unnamed protein product [Tilletia controversa]|nr:unnamed protein product [Tilletia controversa]
MSSSTLATEQVRSWLRQDLPQEVLFSLPRPLPALVLHRYGWRTRDDLPPRGIVAAAAASRAGIRIADSSPIELEALRLRLESDARRRRWNEPKCGRRKLSGEPDADCGRIGTEHERRARRWRRRLGEAWRYDEEAHRRFVPSTSAGRIKVGGRRCLAPVDGLGQQLKIGEMQLGAYQPNHLVSFAANREATMRNYRRHQIGEVANHHNGTTSYAMPPSTYELRRDGEQCASGVTGSLVIPCLVNDQTASPHPFYELLLLPLDGMGHNPLTLARHTLTEVAHAGDAYGLAGGGGDGAGGSGGRWSGGGCRGWRAVWNCKEIWAWIIGCCFVRAAASFAGQYGPTTRQFSSCEANPRSGTTALSRQEHLSSLLSSLDTHACRQASAQGDKHFGSSGQQHRRKQQHHDGLPASRRALIQSTTI